jgi:acyl carrier protein
METTLRKLIADVAETTNVDFDMDADLRDELDIDSHRAVDLVFQVENAFGITIPADRFDELRTLRKAMALVASMKGAAA